MQHLMGSVYIFAKSNGVGVLIQVCSSSVVKTKSYEKNASTLYVWQSEN